MLTFAIATLGCKVNTYESQGYAQSLVEAGFIEVDFKEAADIYVINTCAVTNTAASKSRQKIRQAKKNNAKAIIAVIGCYAQTSAEQIKKDLDVDILIGSQEKSQLVEKIIEVQKNQKPFENIQSSRKISAFEAIPVMKFTHQTRAYLKIQDGCNQFCSYCIIPYARGMERSLKPEQALQMAQELVKNGHKEIVLTGIHTGRYGFEHNTSLLSLMQQLCKLEGLQRIRISSIEMNEISDEMIAFMKDEPKIARHLHIPIQSGCDSILKAMNRPYNMNQFKAHIHKIKQSIPSISISSDVIVGFPNETEEEFNITVTNLKEIGFSFLHVFPYASKDGTKAALMKNHLPNNIKKERTLKLMEVSKQLQKQYYDQFINKKVYVLFETIVDGYLYGHSSEYLEVYVKADSSYLHRMKEVWIEKIEDNRLYASIVEENS